MQHYCLVFAILLATVVATLASPIGPDRFDNYRLFGVRVQTAEQLDTLQQIEQSALDGIAFWNDITYDSDVDVMVAPHKLNEFVELAERLHFAYELKVENVQRLIDNEQPTARSGQHDWTSYQTYEQIYAWLDEQLAAHPDVLREVPFGTSHEGRSIRAVHLSRKSGNRAIIIESNIHAREWITSATTTWLLNELLTSTDPAVRDLIENLDWYIVPVFNVDGFAYTHNVNRMWRKSRRNHSHLCYGADLNRNFDFHWMESNGASQNPCSETYAGPVPFSDVESQHLARFVREHAAQTSIYLAFHSYGQYVLFPYGHTQLPTVNHAILQSVGDGVKEGFAKYNGTDYIVGPTATTMYYSTGQSSDWAYGTQNISLSYTWEFRDRRNGRYGFILPADQIVPNAIETRDALIALVAESRRQNIL